MVRYGDYAPPRAMVLNVFEESRFEGAWRDVVAAGVMFGVGLSEMVGLIPVVFDGPDDREPFLVWDRFCARLWERVDVVPGLVAA